MHAVCCVRIRQNKPPQRVIEVQGSTEKLVEPNEFTFRVILLERYEKKEKITLEDQEKRLREELTKAGIDAQKSLTVFDLTSSYRQQRRQKDELASRDYRLELKDASKMDKLQGIADELQVSRLDLIQSTRSDMAELRKEVKIEAVKAAQAKASYLLAAIGDKLGKTVYIQELPEEDVLSMSRSNVNSLSRDMETTLGAAPGLSFSQIKLRYVVLARFEIE